MTTEPKFASGIGWPVVVLKDSLTDLEQLGLHFHRGLDGLGELDFAFVEATPIGLVLFTQRLPYPELGVTVEVDSGVTTTQALEWLWQTYGFADDAFEWRTELEVSPYTDLPVDQRQPARA